MHFDFIAEGWKNDLDALEDWLNTLTFNMNLKTPKGEKIPYIAPAALRPRRAYTLVFPREHLQTVINTLQPERCVHRHDGKGTPIGSFATAFLRKGLRLKKFPDIEPNGQKFFIVKNNIRLVGLGIRDDIDIINAEGNTMEGL